MITTTKDLFSLTAKNLITGQVVCLHQEMSVREAALLLIKHGISGAPVIARDGRCIGVFSTGDLLRSYSDRKNARTSPHELPMICQFVRTVRDQNGCESSLCTLPLGVCAIQRQQNDASGQTRVTCSEPHGVPVEWGVVEVEKLPADPIECYMTPDPVTVCADANIKSVALMMVDAHIHRVIVIGDGNRPIGVISASDLLAAIAYADKA